MPPVDVAGQIPNCHRDAKGSAPNPGSSQRRSHPAASDPASSDEFAAPGGSILEPMTDQEISMPTSSVPVTSDTLAVPGAHLYYERRGTGPLVVLVGAPMDAGAFVPLAELLAADHTVVTTDPRGINRSPVDDPDADSTPELRADDLAHLITHVDAGPAAVLGSSGGAVSVLALAQRHPEMLTTVIPHEPPLHRVLPEEADLLAETEAMIAVFRTGDRVQAQRQFVALADLDMPEEIFQMVFGNEPEPQVAADEAYQFLHMLLPTCRWMPDVDALTGGPVRLVLGIGEDSAGQFCDRSTRALADLLGAKIQLFPGGHVGFMDAPPFANRLRALID